MKKLFQAEDKIKRRLHENNRHFRFESDRFLHELLNVLDTVGNIYKLAEELKRLLLRDDLDKIRYELARIPVLFRVVKDMQGGSGSIHENIGLQRDDFRFSLNPSDYRYHSNNVPDYIPNLETHHHSDPAWCLCSEAQAKRYQVDIPFWRETDSLVDWILACIKKEVNDEGSDATEAPQETTVVSETVEETELTSKERICQYIVENSPVPFRNILALGIVRKSQALKILGELIDAGRIENPKRGIYTAGL